MNNIFSGSYLTSDVRLLLDVIDKNQITHTDVSQKEQFIQSGLRHYSDMLTLEKPPSDIHHQLFYQAFAQGKQRMAIEISHLAHSLHNYLSEKINDSTPLILVSLVRAGLPVGVLLQRAFSDKTTTYHLPSVHYGISIIRDRGLDFVALQQILTSHPNSPLIFIDGWTGKGAIYQELTKSLTSFYQINTKYYAQIFHQGQDVIPLVTLADPAGVAWLSASDDDWLMPASLLNSTISGLISRTLFSSAKDKLHRCIYYHDLIDVDKSRFFVDNIDQLRQQLSITPVILPYQSQPMYKTQRLINQLAKKLAITNYNRIKPTIAEATRAVLRRDPDCVLLQTNNHADTALLRYLCKQKSIPIQIVGDEIAPYQAITIIKQRHSS